MVWSLTFGPEHYRERESALDFLILRNGENPELPTVFLLATIWGRMAIDYKQKAMGGSAA